ncbi:MAG TPA: sialidase family protein [Candidatus Thermoplasmatota archaeon]|nr:sialidase family protein [Candidatus Thermoplasmatota archaeon]
MNRTPFAIACLLAALAFAGCFDDKQGPATPPADETPPAPITAIAPAGEQALVSAPGHRIAEFMVNRDPNDADHLVTAYGDYDSPGGVLNCGFSVSTDGGRSWKVSEPIPDFSGPYLQFDGWVDFDEWGGVHGICLMQAGPGSTAQSVAYYIHSPDGGFTWEVPIIVPPGGSTDKTAAAVARDGTVYVASSDVVATTSDNGTTWREFTEVATNGPQVFDGMAEGNDGTIFLLGLDGGEIALARTTDHATSWSVTSIAEFNIPPGYNDQNRWVDQRPWTALPVLAHDPVTDDLYVSAQSWDTGYGGYRLHVWRSTDGGVTFSETAVPDFTAEACPDPCHVTHPGLAVDLQGRLGIVVQLTKDEGIVKVVQSSASGDHGATWLPPLELSSTDGTDSWRNPNAFAPRTDNAAAIARGLAANPPTAHNVAAGLALSTAVSELQMRWNGEYWGMAATPQGFVAMWIDHSNNGRPQLYSRVLTVA